MYVCMYVRVSVHTDMHFLPGEKEAKKSHTYTVQAQESQKTYRERARQAKTKTKKMSFNLTQRAGAKKVLRVCVTVCTTLKIL